MSNISSFASHIRILAILALLTSGCESSQHEDARGGVSDSRAVAQLGGSDEAPNPLHGGAPHSEAIADLSGSAHEAASALLRTTTSPSNARIPMLRWPVGRANHDGVFVQLGPDTDPASGSWTDWECYPQFTYDGHRGTDIMVYNFRMMDQGVPVLAAASGLVTRVVSDEFDRNYWTPYVGQPNGINIRHDDGSNSQYFHLRTHSASVIPGDRVEAGQFIAYIGSSGSSPNPHLHFELWENGISRDPNQGACNARSSLWSDSFDHPASSELTILDWDVFLDTDLAGAENNNYLGDTRLKNRPFRPVTVAASEPTLGVWVQVQGMIGARYDVVIRDNAGVEFGRQSKGVVFPRSVQWHALYFDFGVDSREGPQGLWEIELIRDGVTQGTRELLVTEETTFPLRFFPLAGRSLVHKGASITDTLRVRSASGPVQYRLHGAGTGVRLELPNLLVVDEGAALPTRNTFFQVVATDQRGLADTMYYHLVNPDAPLEGVATHRAVVEIPEAGRLDSAFPNPFSVSTTLRFTTESAVDPHLVVFDMLGREIRRRSLGLLPPGTHPIAINRGALAPGIYLAAIRSATGVATSMITVVADGR